MHTYVFENCDTGERIAVLATTVGLAYHTIRTRHDFEELAFLGDASDLASPHMAMA